MWCRLADFYGIKCLVEKTNIHSNKLPIKAHWRSLRTSTVACLFQAGLDWDDDMKLGSPISKLLIIITLLKTQSSVGFFGFSWWQKHHTGKPIQLSYWITRKASSFKWGLE